MNDGKALTAQTIYNVMNGLYTPQHLKCLNIPRGMQIDNEFERNKPCDRLYREICEANMRICQKLHVEEDCDIELIINNLLEIAERLSLKMYEYAMQYADMLD